MKEATPISFFIVKLLEIFVVASSDADPVASIFAGWILCLVFACLRFDDALHVRPESLVYEGRVVNGVCWQRKVNRKRRETRFAVPFFGFVSSTELQGGSWLERFRVLMNQHMPADRHFWMYEID